MWIYLGLMAALFYGLHNICKKYGVRENAVLPVLWSTTLSSLLFLSPLVILSQTNPELLEQYGLIIPDLGLNDHLLIAFKALLMTGSWVLQFYALKHLPITIVSPIRLAGPFYTLIGALFIYGESPNTLQWIGFFMILGSVLLYSRVGKKEGIDFKSNRWIWAIIAGTFLGSSSGLYDKYLVQYRGYEAQTIQLWFSVYVVLFIGLIVLFVWYPKRKENTPFTWRWSIPLVGILLTTADFFYFRALEEPGAMIMLLSAVKRSQAVIAVVIGGLIFKEKNKRQKLVPLSGIVLGVILILYASQM